MCSMGVAESSGRRSYLAFALGWVLPASVTSLVSSMGDVISTFDEEAVDALDVEPCGLDEGPAEHPARTNGAKSESAGSADAKRLRRIRVVFDFGLVTGM